VYQERLDALDATLASKMDRWSVPALRAAVGAVFIWFGALKVLGVSPAGDLVASTVYILPPEFFYPGTWRMGGDHRDLSALSTAYACWIAAVSTPTSGDVSPDGTAA
jgi:hypothetical protein